MTAPPRGGPPKEEEAGPATGPATSTNINRAAQSSRSSDTPTQLRKRRGASQRLPRLDCGCCSDPFTTRHRPGPEPRGYQLAAEHLSALGLLPAMPDDLEQLREMWRADDTRGLAAAIAAGWAVSND